jgi:hypothetical protein
MVFKLYFYSIDLNTSNTIGVNFIGFFKKICVYFFNKFSFINKMYFVFLTDVLTSIS